MSRSRVNPLAAALFLALAAGALLAPTAPAAQSAATPSHAQASAGTPESIAEGKRIFRFDTFGDEKLWTDTLKLHEAVEQNVDPMTALKVGLKVDSEVLPPGLSPGDFLQPILDDARKNGFTVVSKVVGEASAASPYPTPFTDLLKPGGWKLLGGILVVVGAIEAVISPRLVKRSMNRTDDR